MEFPRTVSLVQQGMEAGLHVGAQVYVWREGKVLLDRAVGVARPVRGDEAGVAMTTDTIIAWLSAGKPITAVAIAQLWEKGMLELDDPVVRFIPEFAPHGKEGVTLRHILTHTVPLRLVDTGWPRASWDEIIERICAARPEPRWVAGRTAGYGPHAGWFLLGEIVRRLSGVAVEEYVLRKVLEPCGMINSYMAMSIEQQEALRDRMAIMQQTEPGKKNQLDFEPAEAVAAVRPGASMRGPIRELGLFYQMLFSRGVGMGGARVLSAQTVEAITARHRVGILDKTFGTMMDWGLGFLINSNHYGNASAPYQYGPCAGARTFGHSGNQSSTGFCDPENRLVVAIVFNGWPGEGPHQQRIRAVLEGVYHDLGVGVGGRQ